MRAGAIPLLAKLLKIDDEDKYLTLVPVVGTLQVKISPFIEQIQMEHID